MCGLYTHFAETFKKITATLYIIFKKIRFFYKKNTNFFSKGLGFAYLYAN